MTTSEPGKGRRTALVTGASGGIGATIAEQFARHGHDLVIVARNTARLEELAASWRATCGVAVTPIGSDLAQPGAAQALYEAVAARGLDIDYLVNNAGYGSFGLFLQSDLDNEVAMMRLNMESLTVLTRRFLPGIVARRGKLMNVASTAAFQPGPYMAVYYASKAYVLSLTEAIAAELEGTGVTVTALCPGPTASGFQDTARMHDSGLVRGRKLPTAAEVGVAGYAAMMAGKRVYVPGLLNRVLVQSIRYTPRRMVTRAVKMLSRPGRT